MKKLSNIMLAALLTLMSATSCSDFLEAENKSAGGDVNDPEVYFRTSTGIQAFRAYAFQPLKTIVTSIDIADDGTDLYATCRGTAPSNFQNYTLTSDNGDVESFYVACFGLVNNANGMMYYSGTEFPQYYAEGMFLRALGYYYLTQYFGAVPYIDHGLTLEDMYYGRTPKQEVVANILDDLDDELIDALPDRWASGSTARFSRVAAYMLKARIYLNHATEENGYFSKAKEYADKAIAIAEKCGHELAEYDLTYYPDHTSGEPNCELFSYKGEKDDEWIWSHQYNELTDDLLTINVYYCAPRTLNGASWMGPSQAFIDAVQCTDGKHITESPLYDWKDPWKNRDPRLDLFCVRDNSRTMGVEYSLDITRERVMDYNTGTLITNSNVIGNKSEYGPNGSMGPGGYLWRKGYDASFYGAITGGSRDQTKDAIDNGIFRLAELYLIAAEARIELGEDLETAASYINRIRDRVNMPDVTSSDQQGLRTALRYERMVELCNEGFRWYDLRRWGIAEKAMNRDVMAPGQSTTSDPRKFISNAKPAIDEDCIVTYPGDTWDGKAVNLRRFNRYVFQTGKDELWPIPKSELDSNKGMTPADQNPGY